MSSASAIDFQIANTANLEKIERFMNAGAYRENIEYSSNFNTRLCIERRLRLPFFDPQTGVAQNHCSLFMARRQRMPGFRSGQIYSYPAARWRKHRRQYLSKMLRPFSSIGAITPSTAQTNGTPVATSISHRRLDYGNNDTETDFNGSAFLEESSSLGGAGDTSDSKDSHNKEDIVRPYPSEWFYDEYTNEMDGLEEPKSPVDDEYDYDPRYGNKKRRKRRQTTQKLPRSVHTNETPRKRSAGGASGSRRGRRKTATGKNSSALEPPPSPPSFESAAAAVIEQNNDDSLNGDLRSYRKYM